MVRADSIAPTLAIAFFATVALALVACRGSPDALPVPPWTRGEVMGEAGGLPLPVPSAAGAPPRWMPLATLPASAFRDPLPSGPSAPGVVRVVLLGGSVQRAGVAAEVLRRLQAALGPGRVEVLDLGLVLGNTLVSVDIARRFLASWRPHLVVAGAGFEDLVFYGLRAHVLDQPPSASDDPGAPALAPSGGLLSACRPFPDLPAPGLLFEASVAGNPTQNLWTLSRLAWNGGAGFAVLVDPLPDPAVLDDADRRALRADLRRFPAVGDETLYAARRAALVDAVRAFAAAAAAPLADASDAPVRLPGLGLPSPDGVDAAAGRLADALRAPVQALLASGAPVPVDRAVPGPVALPVPAAGLPAGHPRDGTCLAGPCPPGTCLVPGGEATYGYDDAQRAAALDRARAFMGFADATWFADDGPPVAVRVSPFCIDRTEVPAEVQARCVAAGACPPARPSAAAASDPVRWTAVTPAAVDAEALCAWRGGRLPSDVEWEAAARGGDGRVFPWGDAWTGREANYLGSEHPAGPRAFPSDGHPGLAPIGAFDGRSPFGPVDMAGNLAEWVSDCFTMDAHSRVAAGALDPVAPAVEGCVRFLRGGSFQSVATLLERRNARGEFDSAPAVRGARCVFDFGTRPAPWATPGP